MVMMNVQRMRSIVDAVVAGEMPPVAQDAAERWQAVSLVHVRSSANHVFRLTMPDGNTRYLRLTPAAERSRDSLQAEVEFIQHVARAGVPVAQPLPSKAGALIEEIDESEGRSNPQRYYAVVFAGLPGLQLDHEELDEPHFRAWGRVLAQLTTHPRRSRSILHDSHCWTKSVRPAPTFQPEKTTSSMSSKRAQSGWRHYPLSQTDTVCFTATARSIIWSGMD